MRVKVTTSKLVLGRNVYGTGDVFECRDTEAKVLVAMQKVTEVRNNVRATKAEPKPEPVTIGTKSGVKTPEAPKVGRPVGAMMQPEKPKEVPKEPVVVRPENPAASKPAGNPVGAQTMPEAPQPQSTGSLSGTAHPSAAMRPPQSQQPARRNTVSGGGSKE